ncbi:MAG: GNAT family N-acetyltransferase, partial [Chloroflexi bacterium]|nr:GNAT family N-acetyltransferase [Chloroflexota bacterium]
MADITFRPLEPGDMPLLLKWLRDPEVSRWYWDDASLSDKELVAKWEGDTREDELVDRYMMQVDGVDIGEIQTNRMADFPEHEVEVGIPDAAGLDLFIGDAKFRHRGLGAEIIQEF